jgi:hypothetical protein
MIRKTIQTAVLGLGLALASQPSSAVTLTFGGTDVDPYVEGGFTIDIARITAGNCDVGAPCMGLNNNESSTLSKVGGGAFTLNSFWFQFLGNHGTLTLTPFNGATAGTPVTLTEATYGTNDGGQLFSPAFVGITSLLFAVTDTGNVRNDDINVIGRDDAPGLTPLPSAILLFGSVLAGGAAFRWRKRQVKRAALA